MIESVVGVLQDFWEGHALMRRWRAFLVNTRQTLNRHFMDSEGHEERNMHSMLEDAAAQGWSERRRQ